MRIFVLQGDSGSSRTFAKTRRDPAGVRNLGGHVVRGRRQSGGEAMQSHSAGGPSPSAVPTGSPGPAGSGSYYLGGGHILQRAPDEIWGPVPQKRMHTSHTTAGVHGSPARKHSARPGVPGRPWPGMAPLRPAPLTPAPREHPPPCPPQTAARRSSGGGQLPGPAAGRR